MNDKPARRTPEDDEIERHFKALRKRRDWLRVRVAIRADKGEEAFYDERELAALNWALEELGGEEE
jgi:hypothetical protein